MKTLIFTLLENLSVLGYVGVFFFAFIINLIPFISPSNLIIAGAAGSMFPTLNLLIVGIAIALGASIAKTIHFGLSFFAGNLIKKRKGETTINIENKPPFLQVGMIALFIAAISPVPDDPVIIPLGLMRYNPLKFFTAYFTGKIIVTVFGVYIGQSFGLTIEGILGETLTIVISVVSTIIIIILMTQPDIRKRVIRFFRLQKYLG
ncbi:MAG: VTT domain-containing protein [Candidatus Bathyarchaeota archaeon]